MSLASAQTGRPRVFVLGGTGYLGRPFLEALVARGQPTAALVRPGSTWRLARGCSALIGDATEPSTWEHAVRAGDVLVHLVRGATRSPVNTGNLHHVDHVSIKLAARVAGAAGVRRLVYVSVAQPAPVTREYLTARVEGEAAVRATRLPATILRPFYVLGPGKYLPAALLPLYAAARFIPDLREPARRLGLVTRRQMTRALLRAVDSDVPGVAVLEVPDIRDS